MLFGRCGNLSPTAESWMLHWEINVVISVILLLMWDGARVAAAFSQCDCLRQLWLLTRKNLILARRDKLWTLFEVVLPPIFILPFTLFIARHGTVHLSPSRSFEPVPLEGGAGDITRNVSLETSIPTRWCNRERVFIAYLFAGGVIFNQFDTKAAKLSYKLLVPTGTNISDDWNFDEEWRKPYDFDKSFSSRWLNLV
ncbi:unnamed protein product [Haemonchus placei]|uniref:Lipase maturation factor n=1 Tax=Haemonchus placei TaxID=6290 RepID=A0A0N4W0E0_HAEPC|nr:unnamed protein product [Haemonchus placei]